MKGKSEAQLRVERMLRMIGPRPGSALLLGEVEGMLARRMSEAGWEVTWMEPGAGADADPIYPAPRAGVRARGGGDLLRLPFPDDAFDAVASQFTLDYLDDPGAALAEWVRVIAEGGTLALASWNRLFRGPEQRPRPRPARTYGPGELRALAQACDLEVTETSTLIPDLKLAALYRGDLSFCLLLEMFPYLRQRGKLLFLRAEKKRVRRP